MADNNARVSSPRPEHIDSEMIKRRSSPRPWRLRYDWSAFRNDRFVCIIIIMRAQPGFFHHSAVMFLQKI